MLEAIFFDLGSTLWDDYPTELYQWEYLTHSLKVYGVEVRLDQMVEEAHRAIETYCPSLTRAIVFKLLGGNLEHYRAAIDDLLRHTGELFADPEQFRRLNPLLTGVPELLEGLSRNYRLAVISQHIASAEQWMECQGIDGYFEHVVISDMEKLYKPDPRLFEGACRALQVDPGQVVMVGDRLDNDIWPANRLGMTTVRVLGDPYRRQQPRYHTDVPDFTIERVTELPAVLGELA